ncbi:hypothetical protein L5515_006917 [Caenorhabditis briggsae]|uniref:Uncharacterized protein n=1 Tax=Caenorhabditis briggsae TaxID=6238 RepID=A0AAE9JJD7_CAEBR|nr:hypothetical protein L5515_006917 [Caenorhabditis briggsae]
MRQVLALFLVLAFLAENGNCAKNDTLEMELESNITVVKLEHGLKFAAHSEFGLPDNMTDLFNSTADDPEGSKNSSLPVNLDYVRARRSNKDGEITLAAQKKATTTTKKVIKATTKKATKKVTKKKTTPKKKVTTKKPKTTTKKPKVTTKTMLKTTTKKKGTTKKNQKKTTKKSQKTTTKFPEHPPAQTPQHWVPNTGVAKFFAKLLTSGSTKQYETVLATISKIPETIEIRGPPGFPDHRDPDGKQWPIPTTTTRRVFVMYEDDDLVKKNAEKENKPKNDFKNDRDFDDSDSKEWRSD